MLVDRRPARRGDAAVAASSTGTRRSRPTRRGRSPSRAYEIIAEGLAESPRPRARSTSVSRCELALTRRSAERAQSPTSRPPLRTIPRTRDWAADDPDLDPICERPRLPELASLACATMPRDRQASPSSTSPTSTSARRGPSRGVPQAAPQRAARGARRVRLASRHRRARGSRRRDEAVVVEATVLDDAEDEPVELDAAGRSRIARGRAGRRAGRRRARDHAVSATASCA